MLYLLSSAHTAFNFKSHVSFLLCFCLVNWNKNNKYSLDSYIIKGPFFYYLFLQECLVCADNRILAYACICPIYWVEDLWLFQWGMFTASGLVSLFCELITPTMRWFCGCSLNKISFIESTCSWRVACLFSRIVKREQQIQCLSFFFVKKLIYMFLKPNICCAAVWSFYLTVWLYTKASELNTPSPGARGMTCNQAIEVTIDYN